METKEEQEKIIKRNLQNTKIWYCNCYVYNDDLVKCKDCKEHN